MKEEHQAQGAQQMEAVKQAVEEAKEEGFPSNIEEREGYFVGQVAKGESLCTDRMCPGVISFPFDISVFKPCSITALVSALIALFFSKQHRVKLKPPPPFTKH